MAFYLSTLVADEVTSSSTIDMKPFRSWREIAKQAAEEHDPDKVLQLAQELVRALDRETSERMDGVNEKEKTEAAELDAPYSTAV